MILHSLKIANFRVFEQAEVHFPRSGIIGIIGANGHGKSSVLEAVAFALYGTDAIRGVKSALRWKRAIARRVASVDLVFEVRRQRYHLFRSESTALLEELHDGYEICIADGTAPVNAYIPTLLGLSLSEFRASLLTEQKDLARIAAMGPTERQQFLRSVLGVGRVDEALKRCRDRKNDLTRELMGVEAGLGERGPLQAEYDAAVAASEQAVTHGQEVREALAIATQEAADAAEEAAASEARWRRWGDLVQRQNHADEQAQHARAGLTATERDLEAAHHARAQLAEKEPALAALPNLRTEREELRVAEARAGEHKAVLEQLAQLRHAADQFRAGIETAERTIGAYEPGSLERAREAYRAAEQRVQQLRDDRIGLRHRRQSDLARAEEDEATARDRIAQILASGPDGACPTCTRPLADHYVTVREQLREQADRHKARAAECRTEIEVLGRPGEDEAAAVTRLEELRKEGERMRVAFDACERARKDREAALRMLHENDAEIRRLQAKAAVLPETPPDRERIGTLTQMIADLEALDREMRPLRESAARMQLLLQQKDNWQERLRIAIEKLATAKADLVELRFDTEHHAAVKDAAELARQRREEASNALARAEEAERAALARVERAQAALVSYDQRARKLRALRKDVDVHTRAADRLDAFRQSLASTIRPELEELTSGFVALLTDGRHEAVTLDESFGAVLLEGGVEQHVVSGGTEDIAAIALRLAVSQLIAERAGQDLSLLVMDEPFGSLDATRRGNVLALLDRLRSVFRQVLIVSHVDETREAVDHAIEVEFDEASGKSTVRQPTAAPVPAEEVAA